MRADEPTVVIEAPGVEAASDSYGNYLADELDEYPAWENDWASADVEVEIAEPVAIPEPSAFALLGCLGALMLAMTLLRWHFDRTCDAAAAVADSPQTKR